MLMPTNNIALAINFKAKRKKTGGKIVGFFF